MYGRHFLELCKLFWTKRLAFSSPKNMKKFDLKKEPIQLLILRKKNTYVNHIFYSLNFTFMPQLPDL